MKSQNLFSIRKKSKANSQKLKAFVVSPFLIFLITTLLISCTQQSFRTKEELWKYLKDENNGYSQSKNINGVAYTVYYKPTDLLVEQELDTISKERVEALRKKYSQYLYFTLAISKNGKELLATASNRQEFGRMVNQLSFGMGEKVHMYTPQKDTLNLLDYTAPRMYGMAPATNILLVYLNKETYLKEDYLTIAIEDFGLQTGEVKFKIETEKIKKQPKLAFGN